ncbi:MAG TPA: outer membrane protein assembly factor BamE [Alphaproteobacteria bacterium]|nr:outer membrane protein assembly factor BamE [Alphaproteobacteria bacterium]
MKMIKTAPVLLFCSVALIGACTPTQNNRGNMVEDFRMAEITPGVSTRTNVLKSLGSPTTVAPFDDNVWYYLGQKMEKKGIFDPKVVDEKVVVVTFNDEGIVETMQNIDSNRQDIPKVRDKTPTSGNEVTLMEQLLGNVGRFNKPDEGAVSTAGGTNN